VLQPFSSYFSDAAIFSMQAFALWLQVHQPAGEHQCVCPQDHALDFQCNKLCLLFPHQWQPFHRLLTQPGRHQPSFAATAFAFGCALPSSSVFLPSGNCYGETRMQYRPLIPFTDIMTLPELTWHLYDGSEICAGVSC